MCLVYCYFDTMPHSNHILESKRFLRKANKEGIAIPRHNYFEIIGSKNGSYIPAFFQGKFIPSINHNHGYFISKEFLKKHKDGNGFYRTEKGIVFHIEGDTVNTLKSLIRNQSCGLTAPEAKIFCNRECARALENIEKPNKYFSEYIAGTRVYFYNRKKKQQMTARMNENRRKHTAKKSNSAVIPLEEMGKSLAENVGCSKLYRKLMVSFLKLFYLSEWRPFSNQLNLTPRLREIVGLGGHEDPHFTTLNKYFLRLSISDLEDLFKKLRKHLVVKKVIGCKIYAIDATHIFAWANKYNNKMYKNQYPESNSYTDNSILHLARHGMHRGNFFGYKVHILVDCESELPVAMVITSGNASDISQLIPVLENAAEAINLDEVREVIADAGYDFVVPVKEGTAMIGGEIITDTNPRNDWRLKAAKKMVIDVFGSFGDLIYSVEDVMGYMKQTFLEDFGFVITSKYQSALKKMIRFQLHSKMRLAVERTFSRLKCLLPFERTKLQKDVSVVKNGLLCVNWMLLVAYTANRLGYDEDVRKMALVA